jgi:glycosyltransferase involved in cell wall biosynthesis
MKIALDISPLGSFHRDGRTGIFRLVENLVQGLYDSGECDLLFCSADSLRVVNSCLEYLTTTRAFDSVPFAVTQSAAALCRVTAAPLARLQLKVNPSLTSKGLRKALWLMLPLVERIAHPLTRQLLKEVQIYHATYSALPVLTRGIPIVRFLTVYDLVPTLYPDFCRPGVPESQANMLSSLTRHDYVLCISQATKRDLCGHLKIEPSHVFVIYPAASPSVFFPVSDPQLQVRSQRKYGIPSTPYILSVNTLEPRKNIAHVVRCFARMVQAQRIDDLNLVLVGYNGWNNDDVFRAIASTDLERDCVFVTGYVHDDDLAALYSGALAFVYASLYEGFGLPVLEAMQCGVPVITSNISSLPEVVGDAGIMLDPTDEDALCQSMLEVYRDPQLRTDLSERSRRRAQLFTWERCAHETISAYRWALAH